MSRQTLKSLQKRAQKLLEISSEEENEVNAYTATNRARHSPENMYFREEQLNDHQDLSYEEGNRPTDIQLLKKCISLSNQNNILKAENRKCKEKIEELNHIIMDLTSNNKKLMEKLSSQQKSSEYLSKESNRMNNQRIYQEFQRQKQQLEASKKLFEQQYQAFVKQKHKFNKYVEQYKSHHERIRTKQKAAIIQRSQFQISQKEKLQVQNKIQQLRDRSNRYSVMLKEERQKNMKLSKFVLQHIPILRDKIVQLTSKVDLKVQKFLLNDLSL